MDWLIWLAVALACGLVEMMTLSFVFVMLSGGALVAAVSALTPLPFPGQVLVFAVASVALLLTARPTVRRLMVTQAPAIQTGTAAMVGRQARVLTAVTERGGEIKLAGEVWSARTVPGGRVLEVGSTVSVIAIDGATAVVGATTNPPASERPDGTREGNELE